MCSQKANCSPSASWKLLGKSQFAEELTCAQTHQNLYQTSHRLLYELHDIYKARNARNKEVKQLIVIMQKKACITMTNQNVVITKIVKRSLVRPADIGIILQNLKYRIEYDTSVSPILISKLFQVTDVALSPTLHPVVPQVSLRCTFSESMCNIFLNYCSSCLSLPMHIKLIKNAHIASLFYIKNSLQI